MKNIVITGASRGIGFELVKIFSNNNYNIIALSRNISPTTGIKNVESFSTDLSSPNSIKKSIDFINSKFKSVDILINNAGKLLNKPFSETTFSDFKEVYSVNLFGLAELIRLILPKLSSCSHVVNISSIGGLANTSKFPGLSAYSSSKGALNILTEMLAEEYKETSIKFNTLALGAVQTEMLEEAFPGYKAPTTALDMANYIFNFAQTGQQFYNGKLLQVSSTTP